MYSVGKNAKALTLWTQRGAARHAKMLNSDRAWDVFELLEDTFFARKPAPAAAPSPAASSAPSRITSRAIAGVLHKRHSAVLDAIGRVAAVCPQRGAFTRGTYIDPKGMANPMYHVTREGAAYLSLCYAKGQVDYWQEVFALFDGVEPQPQALGYPPLPQGLPNLPDTGRLFADIKKAQDALAGTANWTHIRVRRELNNIGPVPLDVERAIKHQIDATWYALGLAETSLRTALALRKMI